jgi:GNAT superfamily N-acetyltransferase
VDIAVRDGTTADAPAVARIYVDSWNAGFGDVLARRQLDAALVGRWGEDLGSAGTTRWWVAERDGFAGAGASRDPVRQGLGERDTIAVDPGHWGRGVGGALMAVVLADPAQRFSEAILWTVAGNERALGFYRATGWVAGGGTRAGGREVSLRHRLAAG